MKITILIIDDQEESSDSVKKILVSSDFPRIECSTFESDIDWALNDVKGSCLVAVGLRKFVPNKLEFVIVDNRIIERRSKFSNASPGVGDRKSDV